MNINIQINIIPEYLGIKWGLTDWHAIKNQSIDQSWISGLSHPDCHVAKKIRKRTWGMILIIMKNGLCELNSKLGWDSVSFHCDALWKDMNRSLL